jgi:cytochrome d ubiquinol oxidase subunit I
MTELGRQPWIVFGLMKTEAGVSSTVTAGMVLISLVLFTLVYGALMVADIYLLNKYARGGPGSGESLVPAAA